MISLFFVKIRRLKGLLITVFVFSYVLILFFHSISFFEKTNSINEMPVNAGCLFFYPVYIRLFV